MVKYLESLDKWLEHPDNGFLVVCLLLCLVSLICAIRDRPKRPN